MGDYLNYKRNVLNTPHPMYGSIPGFTIADLPTQYEDGITVFNAITTNATSTTINAAANAIELSANFSDTHTSCDISVYQSDATTLIYTFAGVSLLNNEDRFLGFYKQRILLGGQPLVFKAQNWSGSGTLTLKVRRTG